MDQPVMKQIVKLFTIYLSAVRDDEADAVSESFINYLKIYNHVVSKRTIDMALSDYRKCMADQDYPIEKFVDEALHDIKESMGYKDQLQLLLMLIDITDHIDVFGKAIRLEKIADGLGVGEGDFLRYKLFVTMQDTEAVNASDFLVFTSGRTDETEKLEGRWIDDRIQQQQEDVNILKLDNFMGKLLVMFLKHIQSFVVRCIDNEWIEVDGTKLSDCKFQIVGPGSSIVYNSKIILTYSDIKQRFIQQHAGRTISLSVNKLQYKTLRKGYPIQSLTAREQTGSLVGILGKEGSGKTILLKLLSGQIVPTSGSIEINGYNLRKNRYLLKDIIGYVPEEDLLFEELTVYDNLQLNARLYYSSLSGNEIRQKVDLLLASLMLTDIRDKVVGNILDKYIQPGQRRILNIALELMREPQLLLVDNALSGLSMADSARVIKILQQYTLEGNLVVTSISQVGSNIFSYFDNIWILDEGGHPVYTGAPYKLIAYLNRNLGLVDQYPEVVDPAIIIDLINQQVHHENAVSRRIISPQEWHRLYLSSLPPEQSEPPRKSIFPTRLIKIPNLEIQFLIFSLRNFKCKFSRINNLLYTLLIGPIIALILGFFLRQPQGDAFSFSFSTNTNLPAYQFISIMIAMFMGIILSAQEILKERNILYKEQLLEFSRFSYINSKIIFLLFIVAIQSFLYTIAGNAMLGIKGMIWPYWIIIYSVACFGVLTGLLFSSCVKKLNAVYEILVPVFLALQVLFGGGVISYHALNLEKTRYVPLIGELMVSRWGYEALAVKQFSGNLYQKNFLEVDKNISRSNYYSFYLVPQLAIMIDKCLEMDQDNDSLHALTQIVYNELNAVSREPDVFPFEFLNSLNGPEINRDLLTETRDYLTWLELFFYERHETYLMQKNQLTEHLVDSLGQQGFDQLMNDHYNARLEKIVTNSDYDDQIELIGDRFIRFRDGIYQAPVSNYGRAIMYTPSKIFNGQEMNTVWFNISIIWMFSTLIYLMLLTDVINYIRNRFSPYSS